LQVHLSALRQLIVKKLTRHANDVHDAANSSSLSVMPRRRHVVADKQQLAETAMLSKFLYHSIDDTIEDTLQPQMPPPVDVPPTVVCDDPLETTAETTAGLRFGRRIEWRLADDVCLLTNSDMPIFGCGTHPCISLKLRDMHRPINVLTGIDYWLDGLMCQVPEVLMCYHLDGIVKKYELVKTGASCLRAPVCTANVQRTCLTCQTVSSTHN
jgi:hypothetical protein